jgi:hypothetical protein
MLSGNTSQPAHAQRRTPPSPAPTPAPRPEPQRKPAANPTVTFRAEIDVTELDDRFRPGPLWAGRACDLSRSQMSFRSRRMCYPGRRLIVLVHLVDDRPVPLAGTVVKSDYDGDALYRTYLALEELPDSEAVRAWVSAQQHVFRHAA